VAVGSTRYYQGRYVPARPLLLVEHWDGRHWAMMRVPQPAGASGTELGDVSCLTREDCIAVGSSISQPGAVRAALIEHWNGHAWSIMLQRRSAGSATELDAVSCVPKAVCSAVGWQQHGDGGQLSLAEHWEGGRWSVEPAPSPVLYGSLSSVSCASRTVCYAAVSRDGPYAPGALLVRSLRGWRVQQQFPETGATFMAPIAVSCPSPALCRAVGATSAFAEHRTLALRSTGAGWVRELTGDPGGVTTGSLAAVACRTPSACVAVGSFTDFFGTSLPLADVWNGTLWSPVRPPSTGRHEGTLSSVACPSATNCFAAGTFGQSFGSAPALEHLSDGAWEPVRLPPIAGSTGASLSSVSCASSSACVAVGGYEDSGNNQHPFAESSDGIVWTLDPLPPTSAGSLLSAVGCPAATECLAVGSDADGQALITRWDGTAWTLLPGPPPPSGMSLSLRSISCPGPAACMAVGYSSTPDNSRTVAAYWWNGEAWSPATPVVPLGSSESDLRSVSCSSPVACTAVGDAFGQPPFFGAMAQSWDGSAWSLQPVPLPLGTNQSGLDSVSCTAPGVCTAVGFAAGPPTETPAALLERSS
jgi:hypothetical protein